MKKGLLLIISIFWFQVASGSAGVSGPSTGTVGQTGTYTFNNGVVYGTFDWSLTHGYGTVISSTRSGSLYTAVIKWTASGSETVNFNSSGTNLGFKGVTVTCPGTIPTPTANFAYPSGTSACSSVPISYSFDDNTVGLTWYWQTSSTGTLTSNSTLSYTANIIGTQSYYLRAYCGGTWSAAQSTASLTVNAVPTVSGSGQTFCTGGTTSIVLTNSLPSTLDTWTVSVSLVSGASNSSGTSGSSSPYNYTLAQTLNATSSSQGTATYTVTPSKSGCTGSSIQVIATVNPSPISYSVGGGAPICAGGNGSVTLSGSQSGYYYYLMPGSIEMSGTGAALNWSGLQTAATYTVNATSVPAGCSTTMSGSASLTVNPLPGVYTVSGGGTICSGQTGPTISLGGSQSGINYQLYANGSSTGSPQAGTNSALSWTNQTTAGSYTIIATNASTGCPATMTSSATVTVNALPTQYSMGGGGAICSGASTTVTLSGSESGRTYQLQINSSNSGSPKSGNGSTLSWTGQTASGTYTVIATNSSTGCTQGMSGSASISINSLPTVYSLNVGNLCTGSTATVGLSGSQSGVNYQLQINSSNVGSPVAGTGSALSFPNQSSAGSYQVVATNASTGCTSNSPGSPVNVTVLPLPAASVSAAVSACAGATMPSITFTFTGTAPFNFIYSNGTTTTPVNAYGSTTYVLTNPAAGTYSVTSLQQNNTCYATSLGTSATATVLPVPNALASPSSQTICSGSTGTINMTNPNGVSGTNYTWTISGLNVTTPTATQPGNLISGVFTSADQFNPQTVTYTVTPFTSSCTGAPVTASVTVNPTPVAPVGTALAYGLSPTFFQVVVPVGMQAQWYYGASGGTAFNTTSSVQNTAYDDQPYYYVSLKNVSNSCESARTKDTTMRAPQITTSSVIKDVVRVAGQTTDAAINSLNLSTQKAKTIVYIDGLSRPIQTLAIEATPSAKEIVQAYAYDSYGRSPKSYLPYANSDSAGTFRSAYQTELLSFYAASNDKIADDTVPYATTRYELSSLGRPLEQSDVGSAWRIGQGTARTKRITYSYNTGANANNDDVEEVRLLATDGSSTGFYAANTLMRVALTDENGNTDVAFKNLIGNTIVRKQQLNGTINGATVNYLQTYYVYDNFNRVKYIIPPAGQAALKTNSWVLSQTIIDQHLHQFVYDARGRLTQKKTPGQAWTYYGYDKLNRIVLTQDGNLRPLNKWAFVKYDLMGRTVMTGLYKNATQTTLATVQAILDGLYTGTNVFYEIRGTTLYGYSNQSFPTQNADVTALEIFSVSYYDNYDFDNNGTADYAYDNTHLSGLPTLSGSYLRGLPTGSRKLILGTTNWLLTAVFYDNYGRPIQSRATNHLYLTGTDKTSTVYNFEGRVINTYTTHTPDGTNLTNVLQTPSYDNQGRVSQILHKIGTGASQLVAKYQYNDLGQPVTKQLHNVPGTGFMQNVDYRYNIRGWLTSINNAALSNDGGVTNSDTNDFFGMELMYNTTDALGNTAYYNGNVSAVKWKGTGNGNTATGERSYLFSYDKTDKLTTATFQKYGTSAWDQEVNTLNESQTYDHNGNILTLTRNQNQRSVSGVTVTNTAQAIDNLTYSYSTVANQLSQVADASSNTTGFADGTNSGSDYTYDTHGNLTADQNKGITSMTYNVLGKPSQINITTGGVTKVINYTYDASGTKLKMATTISGTTTTTDYANGFVYTNSVLSFFPSPEGRVIKNGSAYEYQYAIGDHQGNTRVLFTSATPTVQTSTAGFESANQTSEATQFLNYPTGSHLNSVSTNAHTGSYSTYLNGAASGQVGVAKTFKVFPGDQVHIDAYAKYSSPSGTTSNLTGFATALLGAFGLSAPGGGETHTASAAINNWGGLEATGLADGSTDNTDPKAFVTIVIFDKNYNFLDVAYQQTTSSGGHLTKDYTIKEAGYAYLYISNEQTYQTDVYFDDVVMSYTPTNVIQSNEYYPFGLQAANSWTRDNTTNNFLYDAGNELNTTSGFYDLPYRNYDATLGRFFQIDPLAYTSHNLTPYHYAGNNPIGSNDPSGLMVPYYAPGQDPKEHLHDRSAPNNNMNDPDPNIWGTDYGGPSGGGANAPTASAGFHLEGEAARAVLSALLNGGEVELSSSEDGEVSVCLLVNPTGGEIRSDEGGDGSWGAARSGNRTGHWAIDLSSTDGQTVVSPVAGTVSYTGYTNSYGNWTPMVVITPTDANLGFQRIELLYVGQCGVEGATVNAGDSIGNSVNLQDLGYPDNVGPHVHVQMFDNSGGRVDPTSYFFLPE